jgi:CheY-like chemotaxis protein
MIMDGARTTVLLVDDEDRVRELARAALEAGGFRVITARNGVEALLLSDRHDGPIRILVTDTCMPPYMDGASLSRTLAEHRPGLRTLFLTDGGPEDILLDAGENSAGEARGVLPKPFGADDLVAKVRSLSAPRPRPPHGEDDPARRTLLMLLPREDLRAGVGGSLRAEGYLVLEARNVGDALAFAEWHAGGIGLLLTDRLAWECLPGELRERLAEIRPDMRILCAPVLREGPATLVERVRQALEEWGLEARGGG